MSQSPMKQKPFFARLLEQQGNEPEAEGGPQITLKFPSDSDEAETKKYPSDSDEG